MCRAQLQRAGSLGPLAPRFQVPGRSFPRAISTPATMATLGGKTQGRWQASQVWFPGSPPGRTHGTAVLGRTLPHSEGGRRSAPPGTSACLWAPPTTLRFPAPLHLLSTLEAAARSDAAASPSFSVPDPFSGSPRRSTDADLTPPPVCAQGSHTLRGPAAAPPAPGTCSPARPSSDAPQPPPLPTSFPAGDLLLLQRPRAWQGLAVVPVTVARACSAAETVAHMPVFQCGSGTSGRVERPVSPGPSVSKDRAHALVPGTLK